MRALDAVARRRRQQQVDPGGASLRGSEASYRLLFQQHPSPMWVVDPQTMRFLAVNDALVRIYGYTSEEFLRMRVDEILTPEDRDALLAPFHGPEVQRHLKKDGTLVDVEVSTTAIEFDGGPASLILARDASEQRDLEAQLQQSRKLEAVGRLAGGIAHDFNNLLTAILAHADRAGRSDDAAVVRTSLEGIAAAGTSAAALTQQLLAFSHLQMLQPRAVDISACVRALESLLHRVLGDDVSLQTELAPDLGRILIDPSQVDQMLLNLVINARDAMPGGGTVSITGGNVDVNEASAAARRELPPGSYVELNVTDTGTGMDVATLGRIFEPFFTTKPLGTGLGLATTFGIVAQSGGHISVDSEPGQGTTFRLLFPAVEAGPDAPVAPEHEPEPAEVGGTERILLVDDDPLVRDLVAELLAGYGYTVLAAATPTEARALAVASKRAIDLVISDVMLPEQSGPELVRELLRIHPRARCLFTSGDTDGQRPGLGFAELNQPVAFLGKPFTGRALAAKVRETLA